MRRVLAKVWTFVRSAWGSLRRTPTRRDTDADACRRGAHNHEGGNRADGRPDHTVTDQDEPADGQLSEQVELDVGQQSVAGVAVAVPDAGDADNLAHADEVGARGREPASVEP